MPNSERKAGLRRRERLKGALAAGVVVPAVQGTPANPETKPDAITAEDVAAADRLAGRSFTPAEREMMARSLTRTRGTLKALRQADPGPAVEPAALFDPRVPGTAIPKGKSSFRLSRGPMPAYNGDPASLAFASAVELSRLIRARKITSVALTKMYLERLKTYGPRLLCVVNLTEERALRQAEQADREIAAGHYRGPLHGIPWGAKDLLATKCIPTTWGAKPYEHQVFDVDATVVRRLDEAGAVLVAKLSMGELAMGPWWFGGVTRNPWKPDQDSSGSSAGPGAATAAGLVGFAIGTETLGSIVSPSVRNGVTGLRPTFGRVPRTGAMPLSWTMDKIGPMARGVEDCAMVLSAVAGPDGQDRTVIDVPFRWDPTSDLEKLRVGIDSAAFDEIRTGTSSRIRDVAPVYAGALETLMALGVELRPVTLPKMTEAYAALAGTIIDVEGAAAFEKLMESGGLAQLYRQSPDAWPNTFRTASTIPAVDYVQALRVRRMLQDEMAAALKDVDCYVTPPFGGPSLVYTNLTGHPELVTRCGMVNGVPQSLAIVGSLYREDAILRLAFAYEQATNWHKQWPDTTKIPATPPALS